MVFVSSILFYRANVLTPTHGNFIRIKYRANNYNPYFCQFVIFACTSSFMLNCIYSRLFGRSVSYSTHQLHLNYLGMSVVMSVVQLEHYLNSRIYSTDSTNNTSILLRISWLIIAWNNGQINRHDIFILNLFIYYQLKKAKYRN